MLSHPFWWQLNHPYGDCSIIREVTAQSSVRWLLSHPWGDWSIIHEVTAQLSMWWLLNYPCGDSAQLFMWWLCSTIHVVTLLNYPCGDSAQPPMWWLCSMWWLLNHPCGDFAQPSMWWLLNHPCGDCSMWWLLNHPCGDFAQPSMWWQLHVVTAQPSMWWPCLIIFNLAFESKYSPSVTPTLQQMGLHWPSCASWLNERGVSGIQENMSASLVNWHSKIKSIHFSLLKRQSFSVICLVVWSRYRWIPKFPCYCCNDYIWHRHTAMAITPLASCNHLMLSRTKHFVHVLLCGSPWHNCNGWLGVNHQVTLLCTDTAYIMTT